MLSLLKVESARIERLGITLEIRELSGKAQAEVAAASSPLLAAAMVCKHGVVAWAEETPEAILESVGPKALMEIGQAIYQLSGIDLAKNSEPAPSDGSSSV